MVNLGANIGAKVLIVDDDPDLSFAIAETVSSAGDYKVDQTAGGVEAIVLLRKKAYAAMFLDVAKPGAGGIGVLKALLTDRTLLRPERVFVITAMRRGAVIDRAARVLGADGVIYKPFGQSEIEAALSGSKPSGDPDGFLAQPVR